MVESIHDFSKIILIPLVPDGINSLLTKVVYQVIFLKYYGILRKVETEVKFEK